MRLPTAALGALVLGVSAFGAASACEERALVGFEGTAGSGARAGSNSAGSAGDGGRGAEGGSGGSGGSGASGGGAGESAGTGGSGPCVETPCQGKIYACGDCADNDADGVRDAMDPECLGSCDDTEDALNGGLTGEGGGCRQDCYFDRDTGNGNDGCYWSQKCDTLEPGGPDCPYDPDAKIPGAGKDCATLAQEQSAACAQVCVPLTPNGCDCFGCCELPAGSGKFRYVGAEAEGLGTCDVASIDDPVRCPPCTPVAGCLNSCEHCELCVGKTTLPADCNGSDNDQCPTGVAACGLPGQEACPTNQYCLTGCCFAIIE